MKPSEPHSRVKSAVALFREAAEARGLSIQAARDMLCYEFLHEDDWITAGAVRKWFKWLDGESRSMPLGESILAIQDMTARLNAGNTKTRKTK